MTTTRRFLPLVVLGALAALAGNAAAQDRTGAQREVDRILAGKGTARGEAACDLLRSGLLTDAFGVAAASASYRPGSRYVPNVLCTASWGGATGAASGSGHEVSLTILAQSYASPAAAVASLESTVAELSKGVTVEVQGRKHTSRVEFEGWLDGVGDKAAWAPKPRELSVAHAGVRFAVAVRGFGDAAEGKARAIDLARRVAAALER
ncbi:MAG: hypothetical protein KJ062_17550 [Thermoanaerobaculia bacterium]|nr:hypothetical protein [Thermoanaerobaculia bacterium]